MSPTVTRCGKSSPGPSVGPLVKDQCEADLLRSPCLKRRGILGGLCVVLGGAALAMLMRPGTPVKIALTTLGVALPSVIYVISNDVVGEITPAAQRGALLAIGTAVASSAGGHCCGWNR